MGEHNILILAGIGVVGVLCQWLAGKLRLPAILFLLLSGLALGPVAGLVNPDAIFGDLLFPFISLSVAVILFEGSLTLEFHEIRGLERVVRRLISGGMLITGGITTVAAHGIMGFPWELAFLFGAITVVTGPTVIAPLLRTVRPVPRVANILRWEGIIIDPIGALLAVLAYEFIIALHTSHAWEHAMLVFGETVLTGVLTGALAGFVLSEVLRRNWIADHLVNITVLALVFAVFAVSNEIQHESGLLAVTIMGIWMANRRGVPVEDILDFKETLSLILLSVLFIILAARMDLESLVSLGWQGPAVLGVMLFVARPLKVLFSAWGSALNWRERALLAWIAPRGIVAAAVSALFALRMEHMAIPHSDQLLPLTFIVIIGTVILQSATARRVAVALGLAQPEPTGFLIVGANPVARAVGRALKERDITVRLCDSDWESITKARMENLPTYYGNPTSEHARRNLDLTGIGRVLALGAWNHFNELVTARFREQFGKSNIYALPEAPGSDAADKHRAAVRLRGRPLFRSGADYWTLSRMLAQGGAVRATTMTGSYDYPRYIQGYQGQLIPLFAIDDKGIAHPFTSDADLEPEEGWTVLSLFPPEVEARRMNVKQERNAANGADGPARGG